MIASDQPTCFDEHLTVKVSSRQDGTVLDRTVADPHNPAVIARRQALAATAGTDYANTVYQIVTYGHDRTYDTIAEVGRAEMTSHIPGVEADALFTREANVGLLLPVADCVATVVYDPVKKYLCMAHLGRHSTVAELACKVTKYFQDNGSNMDDIIIWMAPHVFGQDYLLEYFTPADDPLWQQFATRTDKGYAVDLAGYNRQSFINAGISPEHIFVSSTDTAHSSDYYSHSQGDHFGRFGVIAVMN